MTKIIKNTAGDGKAVTIKKTFSRETAVSIAISAKVATIWQLLTNATDFPKWNSTVISIEGTIVEGQKIKLKSTLDESRSFNLKVKELLPERRMVWGDAMGKRTYTLQKLEGGQVLFSMQEKIGGLLFPLFANKIPSFDSTFEQFALDLKNKAEKISSINK